MIFGSAIESLMTSCWLSCIEITYPTIPFLSLLVPVVHPFFQFTRGLKTLQPNLWGFWNHSPKPDLADKSVEIVFCEMFLGV